MQYEGNIIRPPSEAHSIIFQVTAGCSHNKCTFCGAYKDKRFRVRTESLENDLDFASKYCRRQNKVFLADGDALIIPQHTLVDIFKKIGKKLPWVNRISLYANARAIRSKSRKELAELKKLGLHRIYLGLESGDDEVLQRIKKGETAQTMIEAAGKVQECKVFLSVTVLLGIAGLQLSNRHAVATAQVLTKMAPQQIAALTLMPIDGTQLNKDINKGKFTLPDSSTLLSELRTLIENISLDRVQFFANHASNYLHLSGRLQKDKVSFLRQIDDALSGSTPLVPEDWRAL